MSLDKVREKVVAEAQTRAARLLEDANDSARHILAEGKASDDRLEAESTRDAKLRIERETNRELERLQHDNRLAILAAKNKAIDEVFARTREKITALSDSEYIDMLREWLAALPEGIGGVLRVNPRDEAKVADALYLLNRDRTVAGTFSQVVGDAKVPNGVVVDGPDYSIDCTIDRRLGELREKSAGELARVLFGA